MNEKQKDSIVNQILNHLESGIGDLPKVDAPGQVDVRLIKAYLDGQLDDNFAARQAFFQKINSDRSWNDAYLQMKYPKTWKKVAARRQSTQGGDVAKSEEAVTDDDSVSEFSVR